MHLQKWSCGQSTKELPWRKFDQAKMWVHFLRWKYNLMMIWKMVSQKWQGTKIQLRKGLNVLRLMQIGIASYQSCACPVSNLYIKVGVATIQYWNTELGSHTPFCVLKNFQYSAVSKAPYILLLQHWTNLPTQPPVLICALRAACDTLTIADAWWQKASNFHLGLCLLHEFR